MSRGDQGGPLGGDSVPSGLLQEQENLRLFELLGRKCVVRRLGVWGDPMGPWGDPKGGLGGPMGGFGGELGGP